MRAWILARLEQLYLKIQGKHKTKIPLYDLCHKNRDGSCDPVGFGRALFNPEYAEVLLDGYTGIKIRKGNDGEFRVEVGKKDGNWEYMPHVTQVSFKCATDDMLAAVEMETIIFDKTAGWKP